VVVALCGGQGGTSFDPVQRVTGSRIGDLVNEVKQLNFQIHISFEFTIFEFFLFGHFLRRYLADCSHDGFRRVSACRH
jgi:hypothetical protein